MLKPIQTVLCLSIILLGGSAASQEKLDPDVHRYVQLLVQHDEPTLAEFAEFSGDCGGESELAFEFEVCRSRGWEFDSQSCIDYTRQRCLAAERETSLELRWLREQFSTVGKSYRLIGVRPGTGGFRYDVIEVEIGENRFLLVHNRDPHVPTGTLVGVTEVNGKKFADYPKKSVR